MKYSLLRRGRVAASIALGAGVIALAGTLPAEASTVAAAQPARPAATAWANPAVVLVGCRHRGLVLPRKYILTCADANNYLTGLRWVSWRTVAFGSGIEHINSCQPSCAAGHFRRYRVLVNLWRARPRAHHHGQLKFTRLTVIYQGRRPNHKGTANFHV